MAGGASRGAALALLAWYESGRRDLPWRGSRDPYRVWVSEVMLQQTRVEVARSRYPRFLERFPTVEVLAAAAPDEVLAAWSGLGYYRRARHLHAAARLIAAAGRFPSTAAELARLPGVGDYTAAAVASIAFGEAVAVLDGNVARLMSRLLASAGDPRRPAVRRRLLRAAAELLLPDRSGDSNQALMELGARVCTPRAPRCAACPLASGCRGRSRGEPERYPPLRRRRGTVAVTAVAAVVEREGRVLLARRPARASLLAGLWEVPWVEGAAGGAARALTARYGGRWRLVRRLGAARHSITHRRLRIEVWEVTLTASGEVAEAAEAGWFAAAELDALPLPSVAVKILRAARGE